MTRPPGADKRFVRIRMIHVCLLSNYRSLGASPYFPLKRPQRITAVVSRFDPDFVLEAWPVASHSRFNENRAPPHCNRAILSIARQMGSSCRQRARLRRSRRGVGFFAPASFGRNAAGASSRALFDSALKSAWKCGVGKLAPGPRQPMAYRTIAKIRTQLKTPPGQLYARSTPIKKCDWRAAPSIQRYLLSLKPDRLRANSPGIASGNAPQMLSVAGPNCFLSVPHYFHPQETK